MQSIAAQCWENALASPRPYRVPFDKKAQATVFRSQCHKHRRKLAEAIYGLEEYERHELYQLEVVMEEARQGWFLVFRRRAQVVLPPVEGVETGLWCIMKREQGLVIERHPIPITDPAFVSGYETLEQAEAAVHMAAEERPKIKIFPQGG